jgi:hypothetical protein
MVPNLGVGACLRVSLIAADGFFRRFDSLLPAWKILFGEHLGLLLAFTCPAMLILS